MYQWQPVEGSHGEAFAHYASTGLSMTAYFVMSFLLQNCSDFNTQDDRKIGYIMADVFPASYMLIYMQIWAVCLLSCGILI